MSHWLCPMIAAGRLTYLPSELPSGGIAGHVAVAPMPLSPLRLQAMTDPACPRQKLSILSRVQDPVGPEVTRRMLPGSQRLLPSSPTVLQEPLFHGSSLSPVLLRHQARALSGPAILPRRAAVVLQWSRSRSAARPQRRCQPGRQLNSFAVNRC